MRPNPSRRGSRHASRITEIKIRVLLHVPLSRRALLAALDDVVETGDVPEEFDIAYYDYARMTGGAWKAGTHVDGDDLRALVDFRNLIASASRKVQIGRRASVRLESVDEDGEE